MDADECTDRAEAAHAAGFDDAFPPMFRAAYQAAFVLVGERTAAEDIAQEVLTRASLRWKRLSNHPNVVGWAATVAGRLAIAVLRSQGRRERREATTADPSPRPSVVGSRQAVDDDVAFRVDLRRAVARLAPRQRDVLVLRYLADLSESDVALALGCSAGTVKQHAARAIARLRIEVSVVGEEDKDED